MVRFLGVLMFVLAACGGAAFPLAPPAEGATSVKVCGSGFGHGVGLSQYGAYGRAKAGQGYALILRSYYPGTSLKQYTDDPVVRVLLAQRALSTSHDVVVSPGSTARLRNLATDGTVSLNPGTYRIQYVSDSKAYRVTNVSTGRAVGSYTGPVIFEPISGSPLVHGGKRYRGTLAAQVSGSNLLLVNKVRLDDYVRGVVPKEMPASWAAEALKSQAVAARSYARATLGGTAFDFYPDTRDQVYGGVSAETAATNSAVSATARIHAVYAGNPITAFFHSSGGGYTEDSAHVFSASPYLKAVRDVDGAGRPFEARANSPWTRWTGTINPNGSPELAIGEITNVRVLERTLSGRAKKVEVVGSRGSKVVTGQYEVRQRLNTMGLRRADGSSYPAGDLPSARASFGAACG
ncbi:MAG: Stage II sporulation protein D [uncultured Rubrobacteraceae bacterium]|uniref:Stage II sporulation protein D n=1 Tax=uncultured Rubrobacteraceae bacterium TaxID=349277 RepID=A0A6J4RK66_9ACTN|nr:MAG: Stage II sporulation protein D [uncultured Rubrobacteraceae bacterium]